MRPGDPGPPRADRPQKKKAGDQAWAGILAPFRLFDELVRLPAQRRYVRAARRLLAEYARKVQAAGWILPNWCLKIVEEPPPPPSGPA